MALVVVFLLAASVGLSEGAVYKVGDSAGWTLLGNPNYTAWALSKNFQVGDTIGESSSSSFPLKKIVWQVARLLLFLTLFLCFPNQDFPFLFSFVSFVDFGVVLIWRFLGKVCNFQLWRTSFVWQTFLFSISPSSLYIFFFLFSFGAAYNSSLSLTMFVVVVFSVLEVLTHQ